MPAPRLSDLVNEILSPPQLGCSAFATASAEALRADQPLLSAFETLTLSVDSESPPRLHESADVLALALVDGPAPTDAAGLGLTSLGEVLASILLVTIERADALPPVAPTWPPAPLSSRSSAHAAAHGLWQRYVDAMSLNEADEVASLQLCAGYAGCQMLHKTIGGATALARLTGDDARGRAERCAIAVGRELILLSTLRKLVAFDGILTILDSNTISNKHAMPTTFAIFDDFSDE